MTRLPLRLATAAYRLIPYQGLREILFNVYLRLVRKRRVVRTVEGMTFELDLSQMIDIGIFLERYERDIVNAIERVCKPGACVIDIGANIGAHTLRLAKAVGPTGSVFAFEPTEFAFAKLLRNLELNAFPQVHPSRIALGERNANGQTVSIRSSWPSTGAHESVETRVDFATLDSWWLEHAGGRVDLIKLDVDGNEFSILAGGYGVLRESRPVVLIEAGAWHFLDPTRNPFMLLRDLSYRFWDTQTLEEASDVDAIRRRLPERDEEMGFSINFLAATEPLPLFQNR